jgi:MFS family permease
MQKKENLFNSAVIVSALGYFVDIYDLILFNVVKKASLMDLGFEGQELKDMAIFLFNMQMTGMLIGGLLWGIWGDKKGRVSVLFGSIFMYSAANIANGFVWDIPSYAVMRLIAGIGLAGELGAGITLVSEVMSKENRGYGTMIIVTMGALGAVFAAMVADVFTWQISYFVGGGLGMALLLMRVGTLESGMFKQSKKSEVRRGDFLMLFTSRERFSKYMACIAVGLPVWFVIGVLIAMSESDFAAELHVAGNIEVGKAIMFCYIGLSVGDLLSGILSQYLRSRRKVVFMYLVACFLLSAVFLFYQEPTEGTFYFISFLLGAATGYWALFVTIASEQFGTNIRSTVTTTVPNFVRGAVVPITLSYKGLLPVLGIIGSAFAVGTICVALAAWATWYLKETFGKDLDYMELS